jgi:Sigma-70, region 4
VVRTGGAYLSWSINMTKAAVADAQTAEGDAAGTIAAGPNFAIAQRMKELGIGSLAELGRRMEVAGVAAHPGVVAALVHGTAPARRRNGRWCGAALGLSETLDCFPEELFDAEQQWHPLDGVCDENTRYEELRRRDSNQLEAAPDVGYERVEAAEVIARVLATLASGEELVLRMRFGIGDVNEHTLEELASRLGFGTRERVRQIENKALRKLKHPSRARLLRGLLDGCSVDDYWLRADERSPSLALIKDRDPWADIERSVPFSTSR